MWVKAMQGQIVNLVHLLSIGVNQKVVPGKFTVVGVFPHHSVGNWVPLRQFELMESAEAYIEELYAGLDQLPQSMLLPSPIGRG